MGLGEKQEEKKNKGKEESVRMGKKLRRKKNKIEKCYQIFHNKF